jgi:hypothetical protein
VVVKTRDPRLTGSMSLEETIVKRLIWLPIAGFLLIAGAAVAAAAPGLADSATALLNGSKPLVNAAASPDPSATDAPGVIGLSTRLDGPDSVLTQTLADLVSNGTITQAQSDAIVETLTANLDARRAEMEAQRQEMEALWTQIKGFLSDGVITSDEIAQLPADNPFSTLSGILDDGQITLEELQSIGPFGGFPFEGPGGPGRGHHGPGLWFDVQDDDSGSGSTDTPTASPSTSSTS